MGARASNGVATGDVANLNLLAVLLVAGVMGLGDPAEEAMGLKAPLWRFDT